jgi:hypothetical protein
MRFKDAVSSMVSRPRLKDIIYIVSKENMGYKIRAKFPASRTNCKIKIYFLYLLLYLVLIFKRQNHMKILYYLSLLLVFYYD